jgi:Domain of unknown function (DUF4386)
MMERIRKALSGPRSRITGVVYLLYFLTAILGAVLTPGTANDIVAHEPLFRWGFAVSTLSLGLYVAVVALFYNLFRPVNRNLALLAAFFGIVGCTVQAFGSLFQLAPLVVLGGSQYKSAFNPDQLHALAQMLLDLSAQAGYIGIVFFGAFDIVIGSLIFRSTFLPRVLGVLMVLAGLSWLTFLSPPLANHLMTPIEILGFLAEAALMLWLLVLGVNVQRWNAQARPVDASVST